MPAGKQQKSGLIKQSDSSGSDRSVPRTVGGGRFEVLELVGSGSFGVVHRGIDMETREDVALKFEPAETAMLEGEAAVLRGLQRSRQGFPRLHYFGVEDSMRCMVTELLEGNLEDRMTECGGSFGVRTTVLVAQQILNGLEYLHSRGFVHRDVKPENVMCGTKGRQHHVYLIDFGLAERYFGRRRHAPMKHCAFKGTVRYASVNAMRGVTQSRRDDLEALGYVLMYFLRGALPWSGLPARDSDERFKKVREKKGRMDMRDLCAGFPLPFEQHLVYCRRLSYEERPDYRMLRKLFGDLQEEVAAAEGRPILGHELEWVSEQTSRVPLLKGEQVPQPEDVDSCMPRGLGLARLCGGGAMVSRPMSASAL